MTVDGDGWRAGGGKGGRCGANEGIRIGTIEDGEIFGEVGSSSFCHFRQNLVMIDTAFHALRRHDIGVKQCTRRASNLAAIVALYNCFLLHIAATTIIIASHQPSRSPLANCLGLFSDHHD